VLRDYFAKATKTICPSFQRAVKEAL